MPRPDFEKDQVVKRADAYATLSGELEQYRRLPFAEIVGLVGLPPKERSVVIGSEVISIEVTVNWVDPQRNALRIEAIAYGPSCWKLERLKEAIVVPAQPSL